MQQAEREAQLEQRATRRERCWECGRSMEVGTWMIGQPHRWRHRARSVCRRGHLTGVHGIVYQRKGTTEFLDQMQRSRKRVPVTISYGCTCPRNCELHGERGAEGNRD